MARPIKETPILFGEDARRFEARMKEDHKADAAVRERVRSNYATFMAMMERGKNIRLNTKPVTHDEVCRVFNK